MKLGKTFFSGSLTFDEGNNSIGPNTCNITGSFTGSLKGTLTATGHILPDSNEVYDLGSDTKRFRDLYLSGSTIFLGAKTLSEQNLVTTDNASEQLAGSSIDGDFTVTGTITAQEFHTEFVSASIIYESGSTKFGDSNDDTHKFTGSLQVSGSTHHLLGNVGIGTDSPLVKLDTRGSISAQLDTAYYRLRRTNGTDVGYITDSTTWGDSGTDFSIGASSANLRFYTNNTVTERMRIDSSGNVGIGTATPVSSADSTYKYIQIGQSGVIGAYSSGASVATFGENYYWNSGWKYLTTAPASLIISNTGAHSFRVAASGTADTTITWNDAMVIDNSGNVGIGTTSPAAPLDIQANSNASSIRIRGRSLDDIAEIDFYNYANNSLMARLQADTGYFLVQAGGAERMRITSGGAVGINTTSPGATLDVNGTIHGNIVRTNFIRTSTLGQNGTATIISSTPRYSMHQIAIMATDSSDWRGLFYVINRFNSSLGIVEVFKSSNLTVTSSGLDVILTNTSGTGTSFDVSITRLM